MWYVFLATLLPVVLSSEMSCPDGSTCLDDKQCCAVTRHRYKCCDVWDRLLQEIHVAGREHTLGIPADFTRNLTRVGESCQRNTCKGICCDKRYCCRHHHAECCVAATHRCCKTGYKCCGDGHWCCQWKQTCSAAHGYCISSAYSTIISDTVLLISCIILLKLLKP